MEFLYVIFSLTASLLLSLFLSKWVFLGWNGKEERKRYHPTVATIFHMIINYDRMYDYMTELAHKYKTWTVLGIGHKEVYTADPVVVEYILKTNFSNYGKGSYHYKLLSGLLGDGIFAVDGEKWKHQRKIASYDFSTRVLRDFSSRVFQANAGKVARLVAAAASCNQTMDFQELFMKSTMDSIFKVGFGIELGTLNGTSEEGLKFSVAFDDSNALILLRYYDPTWRIKRFFNLGTEAMLKKGKDAVDDFVYKLIRNKKEQFSKDRESMEKEDILSRFLALSEKDPETMNDRYLRDIVLNFLIAGKDTTAITLSWFVYVLCKHPDVQEKIAQEIKEATQAKDSTSIEEFSVLTTEEALSKMHYLHAVITETIRIYPALPMDGKYCESDDTMPDGYDVKKGESVIYVPYAMGRMKYIWGEDAEVFRPERWIGPDATFQPESPFKFAAFQAGPRICLGKEFAYRQMKIFAAVLLHFFRFQLAHENKPVKYKPMITLHIDGGLHVRAYPANSSSAHATIRTAAPN